MNLILIPPIAELKYSAYLQTEGLKYHLLLSHLCNDKVYTSFYKHKRSLGEYLILDNGADELDQGQGLETTLLLAKDLRAQEVVLPDVQHDGSATLRNSLEALEWLWTGKGAKMYAEAGRPRLMFVPQGESLPEWTQVALRLLDATRETMDRLGGPTPVVGVAKQYDKLPGGRVECCTRLRKVLTPAEDVHLLGWAHRLMDPFDVAAAHPWVRSVDSAKPLVYGLAGVKADIEKNTPYPLRPDNYFERVFPNSDVFADALAHNLTVFGL